MKQISLSFADGVQVGIHTGKGREFVGLGAVRIGGTSLRSARQPAVIRLDTPDGIVYPRFEIARIKRSRQGAEIRLRAHGFSWGQRSYYDEHEQPLVMPLPETGVVVDDVTISLRPATLTLGGRRWNGFSYQFHFRSAKREIYRLRFHASWEIGGSIEKNVVLHQGQCNTPVYHGAKNKLFTTTCLKTLDQYGSPQGVSYQLAPRGGLLQTFDFQYARQGALLMYWPKFTSISSLIDSPVGSPLLSVLDEYRFPLSSNASTPAKLVLFSPGACKEHEARDLWYAAYEHVNGGIRKQFGVAPTPALPQVCNRYRCSFPKRRPHMTVAGKTVPCEEMLYVLADVVLPRVAKQGIRRFFPDPISMSDTSELGLRCKLDDGIHGGIICASVCATHRFHPAHFWGGMKAWRYLYEKGHKLGMEIGHWWAPHLSPRAPIFNEHPEYRLTGVLSLPTGAGYSESVLNVCDWNTGVYDWTKNDLRRWKEEGGLDFLFVDSWANLSLLQQSFANKMRTNLTRLGDLFADLQKIGIGSLQFEGISPFGSSYFGVVDLREDRKLTLGGVVGQNDFQWWINNEDMAVNLCMVVEARGRSEEELRQIQFRAMAGRGFVMFTNAFNDQFRLQSWWSRLNRIYNRVLPHMKDRHLLPNRTGIRWSDGATEILWLFRDVGFQPGPRQRIERVEGDRAVPLTGADTRRLSAWNVYRVNTR